MLKTIKTFLLVLGALGALGASPAFALPQGGRIDSGAGDISNPAHIKQESPHLSTSWESFNIGAQESVRISQPNRSSSILIRVEGNQPTNIDGTLTANGQVALENNAGIRFGVSSVVNVGGLLASSAKRVESLGSITAQDSVRLQSVSATQNNAGVVNVGGMVDAADSIIIESDGSVVIGSSAELNAGTQALIGGGFQGKDASIANAQTTSVEAGATITAPYAVVWSDDTTDFQGFINAGKGSVEVSGKRILKSFDLSKVKAETLLLDPLSITIGTETTNDDQIIAGTIAADTGSGEFVISADAINSYAGAVILAATNTITLNSAINKSNGSLSLTAGTGITLNESITITDAAAAGHKLTLSYGTEITRGAGFALTTPAIDVIYTGTQDQNFTPSYFAWSSGRAVSFTAENAKAIFTYTSATIVGGSNFTLNAPTAVINHTGGEILFLTGSHWLWAVGRNVRVNRGGSQRLRISGDINLGESGSINLDTNTSQISTDGATLSLRAGRIDIGGSITVGDGNLTIEALGAGGTIILRGASIIGNNVKIIAPGGISTSAEWDVVARGNVTLGGDITTGVDRSRDYYFSVRAGNSGGTGTITFQGNPTITALLASLTQDGAVFAPEATATFVLSGGAKPSIDYTGSGAQVVPAWATCAFSSASCSLTPRHIVVADSSEAALSAAIEGAFAIQFDLNSGVNTLDLGTFNLTAENGLFVPSVIRTITTSGTITLGGTVRPDAFLILNADTLALSAPTTIDSRGSPLTLNIANAGMPANQNLTINAGPLTFGNHLNLGTGDLALRVSRVIGTPELTANSVGITYTVGNTYTFNADHFIWKSGRDVSIASESSLGTINLFTGSDDATLDLGTANLSITGVRINLADGGTKTIRANNILMEALGHSAGIDLGSGGSLNLEAANNLTFGSGGTVRISNRHVKLSAAGTTYFNGSGDFSGSQGSLTLGGMIDAGTNSFNATMTFVARTHFVGATTIRARYIKISTNAGTASNADLTLISTGNIDLQGGKIKLGTGAFSATAGSGDDTTGRIGFNAATNITASSVSLTQDSQLFDETTFATFVNASGAAVIPTINYAVTGGQVPPAWATCAAGSQYCYQPRNIDVADSSEASFEAAAGGAFILMDGTLDLLTYNFTASNGLTLPAEITTITTTGTITIGGTSSIGAPSLTLTASAVTLSGALTSSGDLTLRAAGDVSLGGNISLGSGAFAAIAGLADDATGTIIFENDPVITAASAALTQDSGVFGDTPPAATFTLLNGALPNVIFSGDGNQDRVSWANCDSINCFSPRDIDVAGASESDFTAAIDGAFVILENTLDLGSFNFTASNGLTLPAEITTITTTGTITLGGTISVGAQGLTLAAGTLALSGEATGSGNLTLLALENITLGGNISLGSGAFAATAGFGDASTGTIIFENDPTITAASAVFIQDGALFVGDVAPASFVLSGGALPAIHYAGTENQFAPSWAVCDSGRANCYKRSDVVVEINTAQGFLDSFSGKFVMPTGDTLDLGTFNFTALGGLTLPANIITIMTTGLIRLGGTIGTAAQDLTLNAGSLALSAPTIIDGAAVALSITSAGDGAAQDLTINANSITLSNHLNLGTGDLALSYGESLSGTPTLATNNLTITYTGTQAQSFTEDHFAWADGRNVSITAADAQVNLFTADTNGTIDLGLGNLTIAANHIIWTDGGTKVLRANNITLAAPPSSSSLRPIFFGTNGNASVVAAGNLTFDSNEIASFGDSEGMGALTLSAGGAIGFRQNAQLHAFASALTISGTIDAGTNDLRITANLNEATLSFAGATSITAANIMFEANATTPSNEDLTLAATGNITLQNTINLGTGAFSATAGSGTGTGLIVFSSGEFSTPPSITATSASLTQDGALFSGDAPPAAFVNGDGDIITITINYTGAENQIVTSWAACAASVPNCFTPANVMVAGASEAAFSAGIARKFFTVGDTLDLGSFNFTASRGLTLPAGITTITTTGLIRLGGTIGTAAQGLNLNAGSLALSAPTTINGAAVSLNITVGAGAAINENLSITATTNITLSNNINLGTGDLALTYGGTLTGAPLTTDNLQLNYMGSAEQTLTPDHFAFAQIDRAVRIDTGLAHFSFGGDINLGEGGSLNLTAAQINLTADTTLQAGGIVLGSSIVGGASNITIKALSASGTIAFAGGARTLRGGAIELTALGGIMASDALTLTATGDLTLNSSALGATGALTLTAAGALILNSPALTATGALVLTAGNGSGTGDIVFQDGSNIEGTSVTLSQDTHFDRTTPPSVSFSPDRPTLAATLRKVDWADGGGSFAADIIITSGADDIDLADALFGFFELDDSGVLALGTNTLRLETTGNIILPTALTSITSDSYINLGGTITHAGALNLGTVRFAAGQAASITTAGHLTLIGDNTNTVSSLSLETTAGDLNVSGSFTATGDILLTAVGNMTFESSSVYQAANITLSWGGSRAYATRPATFTTDGSTPLLPLVNAPSANNSGGWFVGRGYELIVDDGNIDFRGEQTLTFGEETITALVDENGLLRFADDANTLVDVLLSGQNLILPRRIRRIEAGRLTIRLTGDGTNAGTIGQGAALAAFNAPLAVIAKSMIVMGHLSTSEGHDLALTATGGGINFEGDLNASGAINIMSLGTSIRGDITAGRGISINSTTHISMNGDVSVGDLDSLALTYRSNLNYRAGDNGVTTNDIAINYRGSSGQSFTEDHFVWGMNRNVSIIVQGEMFLFSGDAAGTIDLGIGNLVLSALNIRGREGGTHSLRANDITISAGNHRNSIIAFGAGVRDIRATNNMRLSAENISIFGNGSASEVSLSAGGRLILPRSSTILVSNNTLKLRGAVHGSGNITIKGVANRTNHIIFEDETTITASNIGFRGFANTPSNADLTIRANGSISIRNAINIGTGNLRVTATAGTINFEVQPTITANTGIFTQGAAPFGNQTPATFSVRPTINYTGGFQPDVSWDDNFPAGMNLDSTEDIIFQDLINDNENVSLDDETGVLSIVGDLQLITTGYLRIPASVKQIVGRDIIIDVARVLVGDTFSDLTDDFTIDASRHLLLGGYVRSTAGDITINAGHTFRFSAHRYTRIEGESVRIFGSSGTAVDAAGFGQNVQLVATAGAVQLNRGVKLGRGSLDIVATDGLNTPQNDIELEADEVVFNVGATQSISRGLSITAARDIHFGGTENPFVSTAALSLSASFINLPIMKLDGLFVLVLGIRGRVPDYLLIGAPLAISAGGVGGNTAVVFNGTRLVREDLRKLQECGGLSCPQ